MKTIKKIGLGLGILLTVSVAVFGAIQVFVPKSVSGNNIFRIKKGHMPLIISHGSARELGPDNALVSFEKYMTMKIDFIEMDLCITKDDVLITHHDEDIYDNDGKCHMIRDLTFDEISQINIAKDYIDVFGNKPYEDTLIRVACLEELLQKYGDNPQNIKFMMEIKNTGEDGRAATEELYRLLVQYNMNEKAVVCSFDEPTMENFRKISGGEFYTSATIETTKKFVIHSFSYTNGVYKCPDMMLSLPQESDGYQLDTKQVIDSAHKRNMSVTYWTINDKETMKELILKGADGIITDRPDLMYELLTEMGFDTSRYN